MDHKIPQGGAQRGDCATGEGDHPAGVFGNGGGDSAGACGEGPHPSVCGVPPEPKREQAGAAAEGEEFVADVAGVWGVEAEVLGAADVGEGYFVGSSGNVTDEVIMEYIAQQDKEQGMENFKISDEEKP